MLSCTAIVGAAAVTILPAKIGAGVDAVAVPPGATYAPTEAEIEVGNVIPRFLAPMSSVLNTVAFSSTIAGRGFAGAR